MYVDELQQAYHRNYNWGNKSTGVIITHIWYFQKKKRSVNRNSSSSSSTYFDCGAS